MSSNREILVQDLVKCYRSYTAVDHVSFHVKTGEIFSLLGLNGAGKSTTVKLLTTLANPTSGRALVGGYDVVQEPHKVRSILGVALQEIGLDPIMTPEEALLLQAKLFGFDSTVAHRRTDELLHMVKLAQARQQRIGTLSGGMRRKLDLALAMVHYPEILILDEPTTGLDPVSRREIWHEVKRLNQEEGMTILLITHHLEEADALAHSVGIMDKGKLVAVGSPTQLKAALGADTIHLTLETEGAASQAQATLQPLVDLVDHIQVDGTAVRLYLKHAVQAVVKIATLLQEVGLAPLSLMISHPSLEDVFLKSTGHQFQEKERQEKH